MAVVSTKSSVISGRDSSPVVLANSALSRDRLKKALGVVAAVSGDSIASKYFFSMVPSNAVMSSVVVSAPDIGTTLAFDLGLYRTTLDGGAVVDADFFKAAIDVHSGAISKSESINGNVITVANMEKRLWEHLGLSSDPNVMYDIVGTVTAAADASGSICVEAFWGE